jgi:hypothetical protein
VVNPTDKRFFWLALYVQPAGWVAMAIVALARAELIWLTLVGEYTRLLGGKRDGCGLTGASHCFGAYGHEYPRFLAMRQVQPSERVGGERALFRFFGAKRGWSIDVAFLFWRKMRAVGSCAAFGLWRWLRAFTWHSIRRSLYHSNVHILPRLTDEKCSRNNLRLLDLHTDVA